MKRELYFLVFLLLCINSYAQEDAWVYFIDKEDVAISVANPIRILTQKAIDRKRKHGVIIDARDVPVNEAYIDLVKKAEGITVKSKSKWFNAVHVRGTKSDIDNLLLNPSLTFITDIEYADRSLNLKRKLKSKEKDVVPKFSLEESGLNFNYGITENQVEMIHVDKLHTDNYTGKGVTIAVLDASFAAVNTMMGFKRLRDAGGVLGGYDFVDNTANVYAYGGGDHGTQVLSCMAGFLDTFENFVGTAPDASYYLFRTEDDNDENPVEESYWVEAAERADSLGVDILNTSLGYKAYSPNYPRYSYSSQDMNGKTAFITKGANIAFEKGLLLVVSAGNSGDSGVTAPADSPNVLSIGAVEPSGDYVDFSSVGSAIQPSQKPDIMAQGVWVSVIGLADFKNNGTSFSAPLVSGGIACLMQALPNKTNAEIMALVRASGSQYNTPDYQMGYGIPNLYQALEKGLTIQAANHDKIRIYPNPVHSKLFIELPSDLNHLSLQLYDVFGKLVLESFIVGRVSVNLEPLQSGVYMAKFVGKAHVQTFKLIKN